MGYPDRAPTIETLKNLHFLFLIMPKSDKPEPDNYEPDKYNSDKYKSDEYESGKYYAFYIKMRSLDTQGCNPGHYVIYMRKALSFNRMELEFYFASQNAAEAYTAWMEKMANALDKDECKGYAARKYEDDIESRLGTAGDYIPVGRIQYIDFVVEILLKKSSETTVVYFLSKNKPKLDVLYELIDLRLSQMAAYGIMPERGPKPAETKDKKLIAELQNTSQLVIVDAGDIARVY